MRAGVTQDIKPEEIIRVTLASDKEDEAVMSLSRVPGDDQLYIGG